MKKTERFAKMIIQYEKAIPALTIAIQLVKNMGEDNDSAVEILIKLRQQLFTGFGGGSSRRNTAEVI